MCFGASKIFWFVMANIEADVFLLVSSLLVLISSASVVDHICRNDEFMKDFG